MLEIKRYPLITWRLALSFAVTLLMKQGSSGRPPALLLLGPLARVPPASWIPCGPGAAHIPQGIQQAGGTLATVAFTFVQKAVCVGRFHKSWTVLVNHGQFLKLF